LDGAMVQGVGEGVFAWHNEKYIKKPPLTQPHPLLQKGAWQGTKKKTSGGKIVEKFYGQQQQKLQYSQGESGVCALDGCGKEDAAVTRIKHRRWDGKRSRDGELKKEKWMGNQFKEETAL